MRIALISLLSLLCFFTACKKKGNDVPTTMTFTYNTDTLWTTSHVVSTRQDNTLSISGVNDATGESLDMTLSDYTGGKGTFTIDYRGVGVNLTGNLASYTKSSNTINARSGKIVITKVTDNTIEGTFTLYYLSDVMKGSFTAASR